MKYYTQIMHLYISRRTIICKANNQPDRLKQSTGNQCDVISLLAFSQKSTCDVFWRNTNRLIFLQMNRWISVNNPYRPYFTQIYVYYLLFLITIMLKSMHICVLIYIYMCAYIYLSTNHFILIAIMQKRICAKFSWK